MDLDLWRIQNALAKAITKIAQKACRNGESGDRKWPPLAQLEDRSAWSGRSTPPKS